MFNKIIFKRNMVLRSKEMSVSEINKYKNLQKMYAMIYIRRSHYYDIKRYNKLMVINRSVVAYFVFNILKK